MPRGLCESPEADARGPGVLAAAGFVSRGHATPHTTPATPPNSAPPPYPICTGVNRHEHNDRTGRTVSFASMLEDARLMKRLNFNAVRCSHYPNEDAWYEVCALIGLYVVDEANVETHGFDATLSKPELNPTAAPAWLAAVVGER